MAKVRWPSLLTALTICFASVQLLTVGIVKSQSPDNAPNSESIVSGETGAKLDQYLSRLSNFGFSGAVLVAKEGKILLHKAYGYADLKQKTPNTIRTVFDIASLTKQFTASAILKLESQGKLKTGDLISKYLPGVPEDKASITIHHLLTHTSGFDPDFTQGKSISRQEFITAILKMPLIANPGREYVYANSGYCLLAAIVEEVSGKPYQQFVVEELYKTAGMTSTGCYDDGKLWQGKPIAHGYNESIDNGLPTARPGDWGVRGAYDALTNVGDLYNWMIALRKNIVLPESQVRKMFSPQEPTGDKGVDYGYGWQVLMDGNGKKVISHGGSHFEGFNSSIRWFVGDDVIMIVTTNRIFGRFLPLSSVEPGIRSIIFKGKAPDVPDAEKIDFARLSEHSGTYSLPSGAKFEIVAEDDHLKIAAAGQQAIDLLTAANTGEQKRLADFNERAATMFNGVARGDLNAFASEFKHQAELERFKPQIKALWQRFEAKHGDFKSLEIVGTVPETEAFMTYVKLNFERGSEYRRCRWENNKLAYILLGEPPLLPTAFVPQTKTEFIGYHVVIGRAIKISFESNGRNSLIVFHSGKSDTIRASKL